MTRRAGRASTPQKKEELLGPQPAVYLTTFTAELLRLINLSFPPQQPTAHTRVVSGANTPMADAYQ